MPKIRSGNLSAPALATYEDDEPAPRTRASEVRMPMRETRDADMRPETGQLGADEAIVDEVWRKPTAMDAPPPRPGFVQRWVRMTSREGQDTINWSGKFREGWRPRTPDTIPSEWRHITGAQQGGGSLITVGGSVLCEMPEKIMAQKRAHVRELNRRQEMSVSAETDKISREGVAAGASPIERRDEVRVAVARGPGRRPSTALAE